ncbi:MAG: pro-sigmaK processing inhibitor BofA family protein [Clostridia bacterium]|nr:pro-sigmaK processing inhibitor BofA family protein [Clostridia bacterium]
MQAFFTSLPGVFGQVFAWRIASKPLRVLLRLLLRALFGVGALFAAFLLGLPVVPNVVTLCVCAAFGLPGTALILGLSVLI